MSTSGRYRNLVDLERSHDCGWEGDVLGSADAEDRTVWWSCPRCSATVTEHPDDERGMSQVLFTLTVCCLAAAAITLLGGLWQASLGALAVLTIIHGVARSGTERNETK